MAYFFGLGRSVLGRSAPEDVRLALAAAQIPTLRGAMPLASAELRRARRYERPLAVMVLGMDCGSLDASSGIRSNGKRANGAAPAPSPLECTAMVTLGWLLRDAMRESDLVSYDAEHHLYAVVLPEMDAPSTERAAERLDKLLAERVSVELRAGVAEFPADGVTLEDLFAHARAGLGRLRRPRRAAGERRTALRGA